MPSETSSPVGAIPSYFFNLGVEHDQTGIASIDDHLFIRLRDGSLHTSHSIDHIHFAFDIALNNKLSHESSELLLKRGFEHLTDKGINGVQMEETGVEYDEHDSSRKIKELAALMKHKPWDFFYTYTASDSTSPGLCTIILVFKAACNASVTDEMIHNPDTYVDLLPWYKDI